jgi:hypothetical protein
VSIKEKIKKTLTEEPIPGAGRPMFETRIERVKETGRSMIHFTTGPIKDHPGYALTKTRTVIKVGPQPLTKKEKRKQRKAIERHPGGVLFTCRCRKNSYHFRSHIKIKIEGYGSPQKQETFECCLCGAHVNAEPIDDALEKAAGK